MTPDSQMLRRFLGGAPADFRHPFHRSNDRLRRQFIHWLGHRSRLILELDSRVVTDFGLQGQAVLVTRRTDSTAILAHAPQVDGPDYSPRPPTETAHGVKRVGQRIPTAAQKPGHGPPDLGGFARIAVRVTRDPGHTQHLDLSHADASKNSFPPNSQSCQVGILNRRALPQFPNFDLSKMGLTSLRASW